MATEPRAGETFDFSLARLVAGAYDDAQDVRKANMNRIRDIVRKVHEDLPFDQRESAKDPDEQTFASIYDDDNLPDLIEEMAEEDKLTDDQLGYINKFLEAGQAAMRVENMYESAMAVVEAEPIFYDWMEHVYGISHVRGAKLLNHLQYNEMRVERTDAYEPGDYPHDPRTVVAVESEDGFDATLDAYETALAFNRALSPRDDPAYSLSGRPRPSNLVAYAGYAPGQRRVAGEKLGFDPALKTLMYQVGEGFIKGGQDSFYRREFYDPYKAEQERRMKESVCRRCGETAEDHSVKGAEGHDRAACPEGDGVVKPEDFAVPDAPEDATPAWRQGHVDFRARRYMAKAFLKHYWAISRTMKGLHVPEDWVVTHGEHDRRIDVPDNPFYAWREVYPGTLGELERKYDFKTDLL